MSVDDVGDEDEDGRRILSVYGVILSLERETRMEMEEVSE